MRASDSDDPIVAAHGIVHPANPGNLIHTNPANARYARVQVDEVVEAYLDYPIPIPVSDEIFNLGHARCTFIEWLKEDIFLDVPDPTGMALGGVPAETVTTRHQTILQIKEAPTSAPQEHGCDDDQDEVTSPGRTMANLSDGNELEMMATKASEASLLPKDDENPKGISPASVATKKTPSKRDVKKSSKKQAKEKAPKSVVQPVKYLSRPEVNLTTGPSLSGGCAAVRRILSNNVQSKSKVQFQVTFKPVQEKEAVSLIIKYAHLEEMWKLTSLGDDLMKFFCTA